MSGLTGLPASQGAKSNSEYAVYRALHDYIPTEQDIADGCLAVCCGDLLQVKRPFVVSSGTEWKPECKLVFVSNFVCEFTAGPQRNLFIPVTVVWYDTLILKQ